MSGPAPARNLKAEAVLNELSHDLMSPYCPGRTIASCPSGAARELEEDIYDQAAAGKSRQEIETALVDRFGPEVIGYAGKPIVLWGSAAVGLVALLLLAVVGRRWARRSPRSGASAATAPVAAQGPSAAELHQLEDELDALDEF